MLETLAAEKLVTATGGGGMFDSPLAVLAIPLFLAGWGRSSSSTYSPPPAPAATGTTHRPSAAPGAVGRPLDIRPAAQRGDDHRR